jgi:hypothetical protein
MKITSIILCFCILSGSGQFAFAQSNPTFKTNTLVKSGKKTNEAASTLVFKENSFAACLKKNKSIIKEFNYSDILGLEYSNSQKPILSAGGAIAATFLLGFWVVPLLFKKKKQHWISIRTNNDYLVMRLNRGNYRRILNEFVNHKVAVKTATEDENSNDGKKD